MQAVARIDDLIAHLLTDRERAIAALTRHGVRPVQLQGSDEVFYERVALYVLNAEFPAKRGLKGPPCR